MCRVVRVRISNIIVTGVKRSRSSLCTCRSFPFVGSCNTTLRFSVWRWHFTYLILGYKQALPMSRLAFECAFELSLTSTRRCNFLKRTPKKSTRPWGSNRVLVTQVIFVAVNIYQKQATEITNFFPPLLHQKRKW